jgi:DNA polymerase-1
MPSTGTKYAKAFKQCLTAPDGYTIVAVDFDSLEDRIAAKITQDPNKLGVYQEGFDGHSLRAYYYYPDKIPRMEVTPHNINKIAETHPDLRQASKPITFALTYLGTASTLVKNCGLTLDEAERIEASYHELYKVADDYVDERIQQAAKDGYVEGAFGFKLRAEILKKVLLNDKKTPHQIQKYTRTLGNMLGQSYGLLNSRAANQIFCDVTLDHHDIYPIAQIHDSQYYIVKDDPMTIYELCEALKKAISWNKLPELQQDTIELSGTPQISFTNWADLQDILYTTYDEFMEQYTLKKSL